MIVEEIKLSAVQFKSNNIIDDNLMTVMIVVMMNCDRDDDVDVGKDNEGKNTNSTMVSDDYDDYYDDD